jgi:hypothetical protein
VAEQFHLAADGADLKMSPALAAPSLILFPRPVTTLSLGKREVFLPSASACPDTRILDAHMLVRYRVQAPSCAHAPSPEPGGWNTSCGECSRCCLSFPTLLLSSFQRLAVGSCIPGEAHRSKINVAPCSHVC